MKWVYYNEIDPLAASWLRGLIAAGELPEGEVDERDIRDVRPVELAGFAQCHFFAGLGGWPRALRDAGWPDGRPAWTGSCPCQPFSQAGRGEGFMDERHLWPAFDWLIGQSAPECVLGEQVEGPDGLMWLDLVFSDLEARGYTCGAAVFPAAGLGAPHIRSRTYWMADAERAGLAQRQRNGGVPRRAHGADAGQTLERSCATGGLGDASGARGGWDARAISGAQREGDRERSEPRREPDELVAASFARRPGPTNGVWRNADWIFCRDGDWRPIEPGTFPLAHGISNRVGRLRAYGNAVCLPQATAFVEAVMEV